MEPEDLSIHCNQLVIDLLPRIIHQFVSSLLFKPAMFWNFLFLSKKISLLLYRKDLRIIQYVYRIWLSLYSMNPHKASLLFINATRGQEDQGIKYLFSRDN